MKFRLQWCVFLLFPGAGTSQAFWEWFLNSPIYQSLPGNKSARVLIKRNSTIVRQCPSSLPGLGGGFKMLGGFSCLSIEAISIFKKEKKKRGFF